MIYDKRRKVRELFNIALCDSKSDDSRVQKQSASYYGWDYIWKEGLKSFFTGTFAFAGLVVMWVAVNAAELLDRINKLDFKAIGVTIGILYIAFMAVYILSQLWCILQDIRPAEEKCANTQIT